MMHALQGQPLPQEADAASLSRLNDVVLPPGVSLAPSAPGWTLVGLTVVVFLVVLAVTLFRRHRALRYRRAALARLQDLRAANEPAALPTLLKRVALCAYPRAEVAALSGGAWTRFLDRTGGKGAFAKGPGADLAALAYRGPFDRRGEALFDAAEAWIRAQGPAR